MESNPKKRTLEEISGDIEAQERVVHQKTEELEALRRELEAHPDQIAARLSAWCVPADVQKSLADEGLTGLSWTYDPRFRTKVCGAGTVVAECEQWRCTMIFANDSTQYSASRWPGGDGWQSDSFVPIDDNGETDDEDDELAWNGTWWQRAMRANRGEDDEPRVKAALAATGLYAWDVQSISF